MESQTESRFTNLKDFLAKHSAKQENNTGKEITHTRIGNKADIYGGSYIIPKEELKTFYKLYYKHVFEDKNKEYLTEKQLDKNGPMLVDFDFRYTYDTEDKQYTIQDISDMISVYLDILKECYIFDESQPFYIYVFEKPHVNRLEDKSVTKDGIHMLFGLQVDHTMQLIIREKVIEQLEKKNVWENLELLNDWNSVLDDGICKGSTNWQLYGSRKPGNEAYELTCYTLAKYDSDDGEFRTIPKKVSEFDMKNNFDKLTAQFDGNPRFELNPKILDVYNKRLESRGSGTRAKKPPSKNRVNLLVEDDDENDCVQISVNDITNMEILKKAVNNLLNSLKPDEYKIQEIHEYTQILPEKYYEPGSHLLNRKVAFALKNTDNRLFLSWVMLRSKASDFDFSTIPSLYYSWVNHFNKSHKANKDDKDYNDSDKYLTGRSIMYWAKQDAYDEYERVKKQTVSYYINKSLEHEGADYDIAKTLYQMYKEKYISATYKKNIYWYVFENHKWTEDTDGMSMQLKMSTELYRLYGEKQDEAMNEMQNLEKGDEDLRDAVKEKAKIIGKIMKTLKQHSMKQNFMKEAKAQFYDKNFEEEINKNPYLMCFNNGVVDFKNKCFRPGYPEDCITISTGIDYVDPNLPEHAETRRELIEFMEKLFPNENMRKYVWEHLASVLIGVNMNQTFNIYVGSGSNGKSVLTSLMAKMLGQYAGILKIQALTGGANQDSSSASPEFFMLRYSRYVVSHEPSEGKARLDDGLMKTLTGGEDIQCRGLFGDPVNFKPQFTLAVCTNKPLEIKTMDDGTWRRIRYIIFESKFVDDVNNHPYDTTHVFKKDPALLEDETMRRLAPVFAGMLVEIAFKTGGVVKDCPEVLESSNKYKMSQDHLSQFMSQRIQKTGDKADKVKKTELTNEFKRWFLIEYGDSKGTPKNQDLYALMDKKFGVCKTSGWQGVKILYEETDEMDDLNNIEDDK